MKAGIISDTHDVAGCVEDAAALFRAEGVGLVIHLGDVCGPGLLAPFVDNCAALLGVFGNNDRDRDAIRAASGGGFDKGPRIVEAHGRAIAMAHAFGELRDELGRGGRFDLVLFGHTHRPVTMRIGRAVVINPGEGCGLLTGRRTCAIVDLGTMEARIVDIPEGSTGGPRAAQAPWTPTR